MDLGCIEEIKHKIDTGNESFIYMRPRRVPIAMEDKVENMVTELRENGIIRDSNSPWNEPQWFW